MSNKHKFLQPPNKIKPEPPEKEQFFALLNLAVRKGEKVSRETPVPKISI